MENHYIGIDVGKSTLEVYLPKGEVSCSYDNNQKGIKQLYGKLNKVYRKEVEKVVFIYEATGNYSHLLTKTCAKKKTRIYLIRPRQSSNFAKALGSRNKTDKIDAKMLASMHMVFEREEPEVPVIDETTETIRTLMSYYKHLQKDRIRNSNFLESLKAKGETGTIVKKIETRIRKIREEEQQIIEEIKSVIKEDPIYAQGFVNISSIVGIGDVAAIILLYLFINYPEANHKQITALTGLDPIIVESGTSVRRRSKISKQGHQLTRNLLFMPAMVAIRSNKEMQTFYNRLKENGKHTTQVQVAVMRKLLLLAHSLYKNNTTYDKNRYLVNVV